MKMLSEEKPLTFGQVWTEITTQAYEPYWREHRGEFGVRAAFFLVAGAIVRWFSKPERVPQTAQPHGQPRPA
jgi:hypothetical protein